MHIYINNRELNLDSYIKNGVSYINFNGNTIPIKDFFEKIGFKVNWDNKNKTINISDETFNSSGKTDVQAKIKKLGLKSIKELQEIFGLVPDGIAGKNTLNLLNRLDKIKNFKLDEFRCKHCKKLKLDIKLLELLEKIRLKTGPLIINSGYRCPSHNKNIGGSPSSQHLEGTASDIRPISGGFKVNKVYTVSNDLNPHGGVGKYNTFIHVDCRGYRSRWNG